MGFSNKVFSAYSLQFSAFLAHLVWKRAKPDLPAQDNHFCLNKGIFKKLNIQIHKQSVKKTAHLSGNVIQTDIRSSYIYPRQSFLLMPSSQ